MEGQGDLRLRRGRLVFCVLRGLERMRGDMQLDLAVIVLRKDERASKLQRAKVAQSVVRSGWVVVKAHLHIELWNPMCMTPLHMQYR